MTEIKTDSHPQLSEPWREYHTKTPEGTLIQLCYYPPKEDSYLVVLERGSRQISLTSNFNAKEVYADPSSTQVKEFVPHIDYLLKDSKMPSMYQSHLQKILARVDGRAM